MLLEGAAAWREWRGEGGAEGGRGAGRVRDSDRGVNLNAFDNRAVIL